MGQDRKKEKRKREREQKRGQGYRQGLMAVTHHATVGLSPLRIYIILLRTENNGELLTGSTESWQML